MFTYSKSRTDEDRLAESNREKERKRENGYQKEKKKMVPEKELILQINERSQN